MAPLLLVSLLLFSGAAVVCRAHRPRTHFFTFGTADHRAAAHRNAKSAATHGFDVTHVFGPADIDATFKERNAAVLSQRRGYGYWAWKPYLVSRYLTYNASEGDFACYNDASYEIVSHNVLLVLQSAMLPNCSVLAFTSKPDEGEYPEIDWTKGDAFLLMNAAGGSDGDSRQAWMGFVCFIRNFDSIQFAHQWLTYMHDPRIVTDSKSTLAPDAPSFRENRHDQTVGSLLLKRWGCAAHTKFPRGIVYNHHLYG
jgi:hypothetical protein